MQNENPLSSAGPMFSYLISLLTKSVLCPQQVLYKPTHVDTSDASLVVLFLLLSASLSKSAYQRSSGSAVTQDSTAYNACHIPKSTGPQSQHPVTVTGKQLPILATKGASLWNSLFWLYFKMRHISGCATESVIRNSFLDSSYSRSRKREDICIRSALSFN